MQAVPGLMIVLFLSLRPEVSASTLSMGGILKNLSHLPYFILCRPFDNQSEDGMRRQTPYVIAESTTAGRLVQQRRCKVLKSSPISLYPEQFWSHMIY